MCDSQNKEIAVLENQLTGEGEDIKSLIGEGGKVSDMEKKHVYDVYEKIAPHFSNTRYKPWGKVQEYLESLPPGTLNLDIGCGNGKYLEINKENIFTIGTDRSFNLIGIC
jgi:alkylated DNA repair protein alkB family protein 8